MPNEGEAVHILDPSLKFQPERSEDLFRDFTAKGEYYDRVEKFYELMHTVQSYDFAKSRLAYWTRFDHGEMSVMETLEALNAFVDESDPDIGLPNSFHAYQTAERIREVHPDKPWLQLTGLIHDIGKIMSVWGEPQNAISGDTFPTGCQYQKNIVFGPESFKHNVDYNNPVYQTKLGVYEENCGLDKVVMSWGHDEYMYRVLRHNKCSLPEEALFIIRYHSFYPWHTGGDYMYLCNDQDINMLQWVREFNKFDLYSKSDAIPDVDQLRPYYQSLVDQYLPSKMKW